MANANAPRGLVPYRYDSGAPYNGAANIYFVPASYGSAIYVGDPVVTVTNSEDAGSGIPTVQLATAGGGTTLLGPMVGIVAGGEPIIGVTRDLPVYHPASTAGFVLVADDPSLLFLIQEDGVGGAMAAGAAGRNADLVAGAGSTVTGQSGWQLDSSTLATTNTLQMRIRRLLEQTDNVAGLSAKWLCRINLHELLNPLGV
jgi:hypothetical protein